MTTPAIRELATIQKSLAGQHVLSAYFSTRTNNPTQRNLWRAKLKGALRKLDAALATAAKDERHAFDRARKAIEALGSTDFPPTNGVACFITSRGVQYVASLPFTIEASVTWTLGIALAPFVRALKQQRPVILAVADGQSAHIYRYDTGPLTALETLQVEPHLRQPTHMSARVGPRFHIGTRGVAGQDETQREWAAATERLAHRVAQQIAHHAGEDAWVLLAGRTDVVHQIETALPKGVQHRMGEVPGVSVHSPLHELADAAHHGASVLRDAEDAHALRHLANSGDEHHGAAVGENAARRALDLASVSRLYISSRYLAENAARAESVVRAALEQGADIEAVSGFASATLDEMGGIAARLRYSTN